MLLLAFCIIALTSSSVHPLLLIMLPRYLKESVSSSGSPPSVTGLLFFMLAFMILILLMLMLSPICVDTVFRRSVCPVSVGDCGTGERGRLQNPGLPTGSKASTVYHFFFLFSVVLVIIQSMASRKRKGDRRHPCPTPVFIMNEFIVCYGMPS